MLNVWTPMSHFYYKATIMWQKYTMKHLLLLLREFWDQAVSVFTSVFYGYHASILFHYHHHLQGILQILTWWIFISLLPGY